MQVFYSRFQKFVLGYGNALAEDPNDGDPFNMGNAAGDNDTLEGLKQTALKFGTLLDGMTYAFC